jgi:bifunctional DNase/RNase
MEAPDTVAVKIDSIRTQPDMDNHRVVVLREEGADRILPIWIGNWEADAIDMAMRGQQPDRPMTHDLTLRLLESLGARVQHVVLTRLVENTFYADIQLALDGKTQQVDARPSDALALAVRVGTPIYATRSLLDAAGGPDDEATWAERAKAIQPFRASQAEATAEPPQSAAE